MGDGSWEMGYGRWEMGDGRWDYGMRTATVSWIIQPGGRISYIQSSISDAFFEGTKKGSFRLFKYFREGGMTEGGSNAELFISYLQYGAKSFLQRFIAAMASLASSFSAVSPGYLN